MTKSETKSINTQPYVLADGEGTATWFVGALMVAKAEGAFDLLDQLVPPNYAPPRHVHHREDEAWYVLKGAATFWCGAETLTASEGAFVFLPRGIEHTFKVGPEGARLLTMLVPGGFGKFVTEAGEPAMRLTVPDSGPVDPKRLAELASRHGIVITGPPPT